MENSKYISVRFIDNWADEMDIDGFEVVERESFIKYYDKIKAIDHIFEVSFGSNEYNTYNNGKSFLDRVHTEEVTDDEATMYNKIVGPVGFTASELMEQILENEEDEEDED
jgi:hypothetical protein